MSKQRRLSAAATALLLEMDAQSWAEAARYVAGSGGVSWDKVAAVLKELAK